MAQATNIQSVSIGYGNSHCANTIGSYNTTTTTTIINQSGEDVEIMRWLSPLEPGNRHHGVRNDRFDGVGDWFLETSDFRQWRRSEGGADKPVLFCSGNPGVGKTYLSSLVIDSLCDQAKEEDIAVACLYYDFLDQQEQTITNMMGAILKQLVGKGGIPGDVREAFQEGKKEIGGRGLRLGDLMGMLRITIASLPQVFICIDALDECLPKQLPELLESLRDIVRGSRRTRVFLTGRPHVKEAIQRYFTEAVVIPISPNQDDLRNYMEMRLDRDSEPEAMSDGLRADIIRIMQENMSDIFLLISLNIDAILGEMTICQRRKKLEGMTRGNGLGDVYTSTLTRLRAQKGNKPVLGLKVLMWVLYSERPLRAKELCHALGVEMGSTDLDSENVPALRTLVASCLGLVTVEESSSTVRLVHFTLQEHLSSDPSLFRSPHTTIAEVCLTYLNFRYVKDLSPKIDSTPSTMPFLEYASLYWGEHARRGMTQSLKVLALRLLSGFDRHISAQLLLLGNYQETSWSPYSNLVVGGPKGFTGLHGVAFLGIVEIVTPVLEMGKWNVSAADCIGSTPFIWAARRGHVEVVKLLLEREDLNPDQADTKYGRTPLLWAAERGHEGVVNTLLEREDVNPNQGDNGYGGTPLLLAAANGHQVVVKMLLEREGVNSNQVDNGYGGTPLLLAAENGHEGVVKMLLERKDIDPNQADHGYGGTPLLLAAANGHQGVVKMLLEREDVNPNQANNGYGRTPLSLAAAKGHQGVVKMLLEREDVNPNQVDKRYGGTPLLLAAANGHQEVVKIILDREDVNPNTAEDQHGNTPLLWAAKNGYEGIVKTLLEREGVNPNRADAKYGRAPLSWAAKCGHERVAKILLERGGVNPDQADIKYGRTPLSLAAENGHEGVVKMLLERKDVNPDYADTFCGQTPLSWAAENGNERIVRMLLEREDVNPNKADSKYCRTPLSWAAKRGHKEAVKILLGRNDFLIAKQDNLNQTPLSLALSGGHDGVVRALKSSYPQIKTHPNARSTLSLAVNRSFIVASLFCFLAFLLDVLPLLLDILSPHK